MSMQMTAAEAYGPLPGSVSPLMTAAAQDARTPATAAPASASNAAMARHKLTGLADDPTFWMVVVLALGIAAARYASTGRLL